MGRHDLPNQHSDEELRSFMKAILADVHALQRMLDEDRFEKGIRRIGAEQEMFLVDRAGRAWHTSPNALIARLNRPALHLPSWRGSTSSANLSTAGALRRRIACRGSMDAGLARPAGQGAGGGGGARRSGHILLTGILPTLQSKHLDVGCR